MQHRRHYKYRVLVFLTCLATIMYATGNAFQSVTSGQALYSKNCVRCHGDDGSRGKFKAKDLRKSQMNELDMRILITNGKKIMPSYKKKFTPEEIDQVISYTRSLRDK